MTEGDPPPIAALARPNLPGMTPGLNPCLFVVGAARSGYDAAALLAHLDEDRSALTANLRADDRPLPRSW
jgi:hypothetical protein